MEYDAVALANAPDADAAIKVLLQIASREKCLNSGGNVIIGRDTRKHSPRLAELAIKGIIAIGGTLSI